MQKFENANVGRLSVEWKNIYGILGEGEGEKTISLVILSS